MDAFIWKVMQENKSGKTELSVMDYVCGEIIGTVKAVQEDEIIDCDVRVNRMLVRLWMDPKGSMKKQGISPDMMQMEVYRGDAKCGYLTETFHATGTKLKIIPVGYIYTKGTIDNFFGSFYEINTEEKQCWQLHDAMDRLVGAIETDGKSETGWYLYSKDKSVAEQLVIYLTYMAILQKSVYRTATHRRLTESVNDLLAKYDIKFVEDITAAAFKETQ